MNNVKFACLGGGVGTVQLIKGLREYSKNITVIASMADDGGSTGRIRRLFSVPPPGDLINCLAALSDAEPTLKNILTYRFEGERFNDDDVDSLGGHKLGNLMIVALTKQLGDFNKALEFLENLFRCHGKILPATNESVSIWAKTVEGKIIESETVIDRGKYEGKRELTEVHLTPANATAPRAAVDAILSADAVIIGPGDLFTTLLPVLLVRDIAQALEHTAAKKIYIVNVANKPFETPNYRVSNYLAALAKHAPQLVLDAVIANSNFVPVIPPELEYSYVAVDKENFPAKYGKIIERDLVNEAFPLYHNSHKLAGVILNLFKAS